MTPYWLLFAIFALGTTLYGWRSHGVLRGRILLIAAVAYVALMIGLRFEVGGDWYTYVDMLNATAYQPLLGALQLGDPGYMLLNWLAMQMDLGIWSVNLACGVIFAVGLYAFAKHEPNPWLTILVSVPYLIIVVAMGYSRQGVAIAIILIGIVALREGKTYRVLLYVILAALFHKTAIIVLPLIALAAARRRLETVTILIVGGALVYYMLVRSSVDMLMNGYVEAAYGSQGALVRVAMNVPPALLVLRYGDAMARDQSEQRLWRNFAIAALLALLLLAVSPSSTAVDRLALYIIPLQLYALGRLPFVLATGERTRTQLTLSVIAYCAVVQFVWLNLGQFAALWVPYRAMFISASPDEQLDDFVLP